MKPISRLRTRARSDNGRSATDLPLRMYLPSVGEASSPRIDRSVDLPQPDGPAIAMYSPLLICRWIPASAWVSTSSVKKTLVTPSRWISVGADEFGDVFIGAPQSASSKRRGQQSAISYQLSVLSYQRSVLSAISYELQVAQFPVSMTSASLVRRITCQCVARLR